MSDAQRANVTKFLNIIGEDELTDYLLGLFDQPNKKLDTPNTKEFLRQFKDVIMKARGINKKNTDSVVTVKQK